MERKIAEFFSFMADDVEKESLDNVTEEQKANYKGCISLCRAAVELADGDTITELVSDERFALMMKKLKN